MQTLSRMVLAVMIAVAGCGTGGRAAEAQAAAPTPWSRAAPLPEPLEEVYGAAANGKLYVFGGIDQGVIPMGRVYEWDSASDHWTKKQDMPRPAHHTAQAELNGKIYVVGGFKASNTDKPGWLPIDNAWEYDGSADSWKPLANMPTPRGAGAAVVFNGKILVIGGAGMHPGVAPLPIGFIGAAHRSLDTVEEYDPATNSWRALSPMPTARNHMAGVGAVGGKIYVIGGRVGSVFERDADNTDLVEVYDPAADSWGALKARMPTPRSGGGFGVYGGKIYVGGGEFRNSQMLGAIRSLEAYDPANDSWTILPVMPVPRHGNTAAFIGNRLHFAGGDIQSSDLFGFSIATPEHDVFEVRDGR